MRRTMLERLDDRIIYRSPNGKYPDPLPEEVMPQLGYEVLFGPHGEIEKRPLSGQPANPRS